MRWAAAVAGLVAVAFHAAHGQLGVPSIDDLLYLLYYPAAYVAIGLLVRSRLPRFSTSTWLDGGIAATTCAALIAALAFGPIVDAATHGGPAAVATNMGYPLGDLVLLGMVIVVFPLAGWQPGRAWLLLGLGLGLGLGAIADTAYLWASAQGSHTVGGILDSQRLAAALCTAASAWQQSRPRTTLRRDGTILLLVPGTFSLFALGVLVYGGFHRESTVALVLAAVALMLVIIRGAWTLRDNLRLLEASRQDAVTDALTGLGNRRRMNTELALALADGRDAAPAVLAMFDLDGFKLYNDRFGHLAGDTLLAHFGRQLEAAVGTAGTAFRPGGDEFCVLLRSDLDNTDRYIAAATAALAADGDGVSRAGVERDGGHSHRGLDAERRPAARRRSNVRPEGRPPRHRPPAERRGAARVAARAGAGPASASP